MVRAEHCFLCKAKRDLRVALHRFPKELATRSAWIKFCSLSETTDNVNNLYLCSSHFLPTDYLEPRAVELGNKLRLKSKSVPSLGKQEDPKKPNLNRCSDPWEGTSKSVHVPTSQPKSEVLEIAPPNHVALEEGEQTPEMAFIKLEVLEEGEQTPEIAFIKLEVLEEGKQTPEIALPKFEVLEEEEQTPEIALSKPVAFEEGDQTPKKRRFSEPRYVGDIKLSDVSTPRKAKRCLDLAKTKINRQASQIKVLKQANRRLLQKVRTLKDMLGHFHNKNPISKSCRIHA